MGPIDPRDFYQKRIDILKRIGSWVSPYPKNRDPETYVQLPHGQIVKIETIKAGRLYINGQQVRLPDGA